MILNFIKKKAKFTPFEDVGIKEWQISQVNNQKVSSILQKCQSVFKNYIYGRYCLGERMNESWKHIEMSQRLQKHILLLKNSVLLYILNSVVIQFTYTDKSQYAILCEHCKYEYHNEDLAAKKH